MSNNLLKKSAALAALALLAVQSAKPMEPATPPQPAITQEQWDAFFREPVGRDTIALILNERGMLADPTASVYAKYAVFDSLNLRKKTMMSGTITEHLIKLSPQLLAHFLLQTAEGRAILPLLITTNFKELSDRTNSNEIKQQLASAYTRTIFSPPIIQKKLREAFLGSPSDAFWPKPRFSEEWVMVEKPTPAEPLPANGLTRAQLAERKRPLPTEDVLPAGDSNGFATPPPQESLIKRVHQCKFPADTPFDIFKLFENSPEKTAVA